MTSFLLGVGVGVLISALTIVFMGWGLDRMGQRLADRHKYHG